MKRFALLCMTALIALLTLALPARAQTQTDSQKVSDVASYGAVGANVLLDTIQTLTSDNKSCAAKREAFSVGFAIGVSELLKAVVKKARPDGSDFKSFPSEHTAIAAATSGWSVYYGTSIAIGTGATRMTAHRHDKWDVLAGFGIGYGGQQLAKKLFPCAL